MSTSARIIVAVLVATAAAIGLGVAAAFAQAQGEQTLQSGFYSGELEDAGDGKIVVARSSDPFGPWTLAVLEDDTLTPLPVKRSTHPFGLDYDLNNGREQLVYARYTKKGGDLYRYDFPTKREGKLGRLSKSQCSEFEVEQDDGAIVFARDGGTSCKPGVYAVTGNGAPKRILASSEVAAVELDNGVVVVSAAVKSGAAKKARFGLWRLPVAGGKPTFLKRGPGAVDPTFQAVGGDVTLAGDVLYWTDENDSELSTESVITKLPLNGGPCEDEFFEEEDITGITAQGDSLVIGIGKEIRRIDTVFPPGGSC